MRLWLDTEFNGYLGELISIGIVDEHGREFYGVRRWYDPKPWVRANVIPVLNGEKETDPMLQRALEAFLKPYPNCHIIVDWPEDIAYFCNFIVTGPGERIETPPLTFEIKRHLPNTKDTSLIPHNALEDAKALMRSDEKPYHNHFDNILTTIRDLKAIENGELTGVTGVHVDNRDASTQAGLYWRMLHYLLHEHNHDVHKGDFVLPPPHKDEVPEFHLKQYGDVTKSQLAAYVEHCGLDQDDGSHPTRHYVDQG